MDSARVARVGAKLVAWTIPLAFGASPGVLAAAPPSEIRLVADRDDDDADGRADCEQDYLPAAARIDTIPLDHALIGWKLTPTRGADLVRLVVDGTPQAWGTVSYGLDPVLQGVAAGLATISATRGSREVTLEVRVRGVSMRDGALDQVDLARSHASLERTAPARIEGPVDAPYDDPDALRIVIESPDGGAPRGPDVSIESVSMHGVRTDVLAHAALSASVCARPRTGETCVATEPIRFVTDDVDRGHPLVASRSLRAEVGGAIVVWLDGKKAQQIRVLGPRSSSVGPIGALKASLRAFVVRLSPGGAPSVGGTDALAVEAIRAELTAAAGIWGQCGVTFGDAATQVVRIVDPPPTHLVAIGDGLGLPASGGTLRLRVDSVPIQVAVAPGAWPDGIAYDVARAAERAGFVAVVSPNARIGPGAFGSVDVSLRRKDGTFAAADAMAPGAPLTDDATLTVRIGSVDLSDGLQHFTDTDAMAGSLEERTLLKALDDADPGTVEIVVVPMFAGGGRIGESFIGSDLSSLRNVVLLDRAGIRARRSSLTLAHELGHVLMDMPGHPDDYGVDTPTLLMDSDASDASPFGPRRLTLEECARVVLQAGPNARVPLLASVPLAPIPPDTRPLVGN